MILVSLLLACSSGSIFSPDETGGTGEVSSSATDTAAPTTVVINEVLADNSGFTTDGDGRATDWLELYNPGESDLDLGGFFLSDDYTDRTRFALPAGLTVEAGGHLLLFADGEGEASARHVGLRLSSDGEGVGLFDAQGEVLDWLIYPPLEEDEAYARLPDGGEMLAAMPLGTPGEENELVELREAELIAASSTWSYEDSGRDLGTSWREPDHDDGDWAWGRAPLGYGDSQTTVVDYGPNASDKHVTTYFRHRFDVDGTVLTAAVRLMVDDGAAVYLNGEEVLRDNLPSTELGYDTYATSAISGSDESDFTTISIDVDAFVVGENVVAAEVHQATASSSDLTFDLALDAELLATD